MNFRKAITIIFTKVCSRNFSKLHSGGNGALNSSKSHVNVNHALNKKLRVSLIGSGNWGMVIAKIVGNNILEKTDQYESNLKMYVEKEIVGDMDLAEMINTERINRKYMPHCSIPSNVIASSCLDDVVEEADVLIFVVPHEFMGDICSRISGKVESNAVAISLCKGLDVSQGRLDFVSNIVRRTLKVKCAVLMGANIASEVAMEKYAEATIGCKDAEAGRLFKDLFQTPYFRIALVEDQYTVELCGALKNIVALGAGFADGLMCGHNTKAAVVRLGLMEMISFSKKFLTDVRVETFFESCGVADLVTTCYSGRNRKVGEAFAIDPKISIEELERTLLCGQKLQGASTAAEVNTILRRANEEHKFPLLTAVHKICSGEEKPTFILQCLKDHPEHLDDA